VTHIVISKVFLKSSSFSVAFLFEPLLPFPSVKAFVRQIRVGPGLNFSGSGRARVGLGLDLGQTRVGLGLDSGRAWVLAFGLGLFWAFQIQNWA
jgi:hypothetical protein